LDLGCGRTLHRAVCQAAGFGYVGMDIRAPEAPLLGDAHALPFGDGSFEFVLSLAVLEHIRYPMVMAREAFRVLAPRGLMMGTVAFLEPFHSGSYYHHTHWGVYNTLHQAGFEIRHIGPGPKRSVLEAQATALFPRMPAAMARALVLPLQALHRLWWQLGHRVTGTAGASEQYRAFSTCGSFSFLAVKGEEPATGGVRAAVASDPADP
jgi:SAM-dependent methyltransferase